MAPTITLVHDGLPSPIRVPRWRAEVVLDTSRRRRWDGIGMREYWGNGGYSAPNSGPARYVCCCLKQFVLHLIVSV